MSRSNLRRLQGTEQQPLLGSESSNLGDGSGSSGELNQDGPHVNKEVEAALLSKVDRRMSILVLIYVLNYIDRSSISAARLRGFEEDLGLEGTQFASVLSVFYFGYVLMQIPSNMFLNYFGKPSKYLPVCMAIWGTLSMATGFATSYTHVAVIRFFLGFVEAAFFPGAVFLISKWYKRNELSQRMALLSAGILISNAFGSLEASVILDAMQGVCGYQAWRWLFFIEGGVTVIVAIWSMSLLPDFPETTVGWLTEAEKSLAIQRMTEDVPKQHDEAFQRSQGPEKSGLYLAISDWKAWYMAVILSLILASMSFHTYFPTITATLGYNPKISLLLCAPPWIVATGLTLLLSRHSDKMQERSWHISLSLSIGVIGLILAMTSMNFIVRYASLFFMTQMYGAFICLLAWSSSIFFSPPSKRAVALALINCLSQSGNVIGAYSWPLHWGPSYNMSFGICALFAILAIAMVLFLRHHLNQLNHQAADDERMGDTPRYIL